MAEETVVASPSCTDRTGSLSYEANRERGWFLSFTSRCVAVSLYTPSQPDTYSSAKCKPYNVYLSFAEK